jgi:hypothetical protein
MGGVEFPGKMMMRKMGFEERWISLIMKCVCTVTYRFKLNGYMTGRTNPRGLRQGGPSFTIVVSYMW